MATKGKRVAKTSGVRKELQAPVPEALEAASQQATFSTGPAIRTYVARRCRDCRVENAFHASRSQQLTPAFNVNISFAPWGIPPAGKRAVIEQVTATISVPSGEWARLRMYTSLGTSPSNLDLVLTPQGQVGGKQVLVATHAVRVYSDNLIDFNVHRDNATTAGDALVCISGYLIDV